MLNKKLIEFNFVQGADTKINDFIDDSFNVAENVTYGGDLTAKKANGFDLYKDIPAAQWDNVAKGGVDVLLYGSAGTYKVLNSETEVQKISDYKPVGVDVEKSIGDLMVIGNTRRCVVGYKKDKSAYLVSVQELDGKEIFSQYVSIDNSLASFPNAKLVHHDDIFYLFGAGLIIPSTRVTMYIIGDVVSSATPIPNLPYSSVTFIDAFTDGTKVYVCANDAGSTSTRIEYAEYDIATSFLTWGMFINVGMQISNVLICNKDANYICFIYISEGSLVTKPDLVSQIYVDKTFGTIVVGTSEALPVDLRYNIFSNTRRISATYDAGTIRAVVMVPHVSDADYISSPYRHTTVTLNMGAQPLFLASSGVTGFVPNCKPFLLDGLWTVFGSVVSSNKQVVVAAQGAALTPIATYSQATFRKLSWISGEFNPSGGFITPWTSFQEAATEVGAFTINGGLIVKLTDERFKGGAIEVSGRIESFGSMMTHFDGSQLSEMGFIGEPTIRALESLTAGTLQLLTYQVCAILTCYDSKGDIYRSGVSSIIEVTMLNANRSILVELYPSILTLKKDISYVIRMEVYIRKPGDYFRFYDAVERTELTTKSSMTILSYPTTSEFLYTEPATEENAVPVSAVCMSLYGSRLFYVPYENQNEIRYTRRKQNNIGFEFVETFRINGLDKKGKEEDKIKGLMEMDGRLIIFKDQSILYIYGQGPAEDGTSNDYGEPQLITTDVGCVSQRSIVLAPDGIMFKSDKGIYLLNRQLSTTYIGANVEAFNGLTITSASLLEKVNEVRFTTNEGRTLIYNYFSQQWSWTTSHSFVGTCFLNGEYLGLDETNGLVIETTTSKKYLGSSVVQKITSPWVKLAGVQGFQRLYNIYILGKYKTPHNVKIRVYYDYEEYYSEEYVITPLNASDYNIAVRPTNGQIESGAKTDGVYQYKVGVSRQKCQSVKIEIFDEPLNIANNTAESYNLVNMALEMGVMNNGNRLPAAKKY